MLDHGLLLRQYLAWDFPPKVPIAQIASILFGFGKESIQAMAALFPQSIAFPVVCAVRIEIRIFCIEIGLRLGLQIFFCDHIEIVGERIDGKIQKIIQMCIRDSDDAVVRLELPKGQAMELGREKISLIRPHIEF